jgi:ABC-type lipoprotein export system ATPase subunit
VSKDYRGLRPLRVDHLEVLAGDRVALVGFDQVSAEVLVNLVTGTALPDAGHILVFGRSTADIADASEWLAVVDGFGIVSERAVLLEGLTALQNLAMPFTLDVEPLREETRRRAGLLAEQAGLAVPLWECAVNTLSAGDKMRVRLGRALALDPKILLLEHVSAGLEAREALALAESIRTAAGRRGIAILAASADERFGRALAARVLWWEPATGRLRERRGWFGGRKKLD